MLLYFIELLATIGIMVIGFRAIKLLFKLIGKLFDKIESKL